METINKVIGFFEEKSNGLIAKSNMRLMSFVLLILFICLYLGTLFMYYNERADLLDMLRNHIIDKETFILICNQMRFALGMDATIVFLLFIFVPKTAQKFIEMKYGVKSE